MPPQASTIVPGESPAIGRERSAGGVGMIAVGRARVIGKRCSVFSTGISRSTLVGRAGKKIYRFNRMQSERRDLEYFGKGLTDDQVVEKKRMLRESAQAHPEIAEYFRELAVDFCVRFPEEATKQRQSKEWEMQESAFSVEKMSALQHTCLLYTSLSPRDLSTSRMPSSA